MYIRRLVRQPVGKGRFLSTQRGRKRGLVRSNSIKHDTRIDSFIVSQGDDAKLSDKKLNERIQRRLSDTHEKTLELKYELLKDQVIGEGRFAQVHAGYERKTGTKVAIKKMKRNNDYLNNKLQENAFNEIEILELINKEENYHPGFLKIFDYYETPMFYYIVTELITGSTLLAYCEGCLEFTPLCDLRKDKQVVKNIIYNMISTVHSLHELDVIHLDLKIDNFMIRDENKLISQEYENSLGSLALIDFGSAKINTIGKKDQLKSRVGSPSVVAPEILFDNYYSKKSDVWALGVLSFIMIQGYLPFPELYGSRNEYKEQLELVLDKDDEDWSSDIEALDFVEQMLLLNPRERTNDLKSLLSHSFFKN